MEREFRVTHGANFSVYYRGQTHFKQFIQYTGTMIPGADYDVYKIKVPTNVPIHYEAGGLDHVGNDPDDGFLKEIYAYYATSTNPITIDLIRREDYVPATRSYMENSMLLSVNDSRFIELGLGGGRAA